MMLGLLEHSSRVLASIAVQPSEQPTGLSNSASSSKHPLSDRIAILTNFVPPYRLPLFEALGEFFQHVKVMASTAMEPNRDWQVDWGHVDVVAQKSLTFKKKSKHQLGFQEENYIHLPLDTFRLLARFKPGVIISGEFGLRTATSVVYRLFRRDCRLIIWATLSEHTENNRGFLRRSLRKLLLQFTDAVIVNGKSGRDYIRELGYPTSRIVREVPPVSLSIFDTSPRQGNKRADCCHLLYVGQLIERKGLGLFFRQLHSVLSEGERTVTLTIVGTGPERGELTQLSALLGIDACFVGSVQTTELANYYAAADILVFPTLADEWGLVTNEALATGLPVLGSVYSQSVCELIDKDTGWIYRPDDNRDAIKKIRQAIETPNEALLLMEDKCKQRVLELTPKIAASQIAQLVRDVGGPTRI